MNVDVIFNSDHEGASTPGAEARVDVLDVVEAVTRALGRLGHAVATVPVKEHVRELARLDEARPDVAVHLCESVATSARGEADVARALERLRLPFTGSPSAALALALEKDRAKAALRQAGVPTPDWVAFPLGAPIAEIDLPWPVIVKPAAEDASVGIGVDSVVSDKRGLRRAVEAVWSLCQTALVEAYVDGRELAVSLLGNAPRRALPVSEITFGPAFAGRPRVVSYDAKWDRASPEFRDTTPVASALSPDLAARVVDVASRAFDALGCRDYGRVDLRLDAAGAPWVIDVNPNCDLHPSAGFARAAAAGGLGYDALVATLLETALERARRDPPHRPGRRHGAAPRARAHPELHE